MDENIISLIAKELNIAISQVKNTLELLEEGATVLVKQTYISIDENAVSSVQENLINAELYAKYRQEMRTDERALRDLRYKVEDEILADTTQA